MDPDAHNEGDESVTSLEGAFATTERDQLAPELQTKTEKRIANEYAVRNDRLFRLVNMQGRMKWLYVLPLSMRKSTLIKFHDLMGHTAVDNTVDKITQNYWFPSIRRYAKHHIRRCIECILNKLPGGKQADLLFKAPGKITC
ncbi:hypothetical protein CBL_03850 [Carabus blaptoides fortunei]